MSVTTFSSTNLTFFREPIPQVTTGGLHGCGQHNGIMIIAVVTGNSATKGAKIVATLAKKLQMPIAVAANSVEKICP